MVLAVPARPFRRNTPLLPLATSSSLLTAMPEVTTGLTCPTLPPQYPASSAPYTRRVLSLPGKHAIPPLQPPTRRRHSQRKAFSSLQLSLSRNHLYFPHLFFRLLTISLLYRRVSYITSLPLFFLGHTLPSHASFKPTSSAVVILVRFPNRLCTPLPGRSFPLLLATIRSPTADQPLCWPDVSAVYCGYFLGSPFTLPARHSTPLRIPRVVGCTTPSDSATGRDVLPNPS